MSPIERAALDALARHVSGAWAPGVAGNELLAGGRRITVEMAGLPAPASRGKPRLRYDKVALAVMRRLREGLGGAVPAGETLVLTVTAPIREAAKTTAAFTRAVQPLLGPGSPPVDWKDTLHANQLSARGLRHGVMSAAKVVAFVHNPDADAAAVLARMTGALLETVGGAAARPSRAGERWLLLVSDGKTIPAAIYRDIHAQLMCGNFTETLMFADGRIESLTA